MKKIKWIIVLLPTLLLLNCASFVTNKKAAAKAKSVAVVLAAQSKAPENEDGGGSYTGLAALAGGATESKDETVSFGGSKLITYTIEAINKRFTEVNSWKTIPAAKVTSSPVYKQFSVTYEKFTSEEYSTMGPLIYFATTYPDGYVKYISGSEGYGKVNYMLKDLMTGLPADAALFIYLKLTYKGSFTIGGTGTAKVGVELSMGGLSSEGEFFLDKNYKFRGTSDRSTAIIAGNIIYTPEVESMYKEAIDSALDKMIANLEENVK